MAEAVQVYPHTLCVVQGPLSSVSGRFFRCAILVHPQGFSDHPTLEAALSWAEQVEARQSDIWK